MRPVPAAPAEVVADRGPRAVPSSAWFSASIRDAQKLRYVSQVEVRVVIPERRDPGVVDLELEARVDDQPVLLAQRLGERPEQLVLRRVVLVAHVDLGARGRDGGHEHVDDVDPSSAAFRFAMSRCERDRACSVIGPTQTGRVAIDAQKARSVPWKSTSGVLLRVLVELGEAFVVAAA